MKKLNVVWASVHDILPSQVEELEKRGTLRVLKNDLPELYEAMIDTPNNRLGVNMLVLDVLNKLTKVYGDKIMLVQPSGSLLFQHLLGFELCNIKHRVDNGEDLPFIAVMYSYSKRVSEDILQKDGSIKKVSLFKHEQFI